MIAIYWKHHQRSTQHQQYALARTGFVISQHKQVWKHLHASCSLVCALEIHFQQLTAHQSMHLEQSLTRRLWLMGMRFRNATTLHLHAAPALQYTTLSASTTHQQSMEYWMRTSSTQVLDDYRPQPRSFTSTNKPTCAPTLLWYQLLEIRCTTD